MGDKVDSRGLFGIWVVELDSDVIVYKDEVIAEGESDALFNSNLKEVLKEKKLKRDDVHVIVKEIGSVPKREKAKTVKIIGQAAGFMLSKEQK